ncbi:hypothetical protein Fcan01_10640 [Folsomia candida]|uniref:Uncharacterized protein n=1 Tax=Folsomia candida TaxID=158441 RepID=A0A226EA51_FOLCA|nr:hypothetical protein Fcan01_10640 [Folsomia candida]
MPSTSKGDSADGVTAGPPKPNKSWVSILASHLKAIAELQSLPNEIRQIKEILLGTQSNGQRNSVGVVDDTMQSLLQHEKEVIDSILVDDGPIPELLDILNEILSKERIEELRKTFLTPANCKLLGVPRVNPEIWTVLPQKSKQGDFQSQQMLAILSSSTVALAHLAEKVMLNSKKMPPELSQDLLGRTMQAATLNSKLRQDINIKRKQDIKPALSTEIVVVCNTPSTPELLF